MTVRLLRAVFPSASVEHPPEVGAPSRAGRARRARQPRGVREAGSSRCAAGSRSRSSTSRCARSSTADGSTSPSSSLSRGTPRRASQVTWRMRIGRTSTVTSTASTRRSWSTTRRSIAASRTADTRSTHDCATGCARSVSERAQPSRSRDLSRKGRPRGGSFRGRVLGVGGGGHRPGAGSACRPRRVADLGLERGRLGRIRAALPGGRT